jgi:protein phosphatase
MELTRRLVLREELAAPEHLSCGGGRATVITIPSPDRADASGNEDGALVMDLGEGRGVLAVADGVGGGPGGAEAAAAALAALADAVDDEVKRGGEIRTAIVDGIERAQDAVRAIGGGAATTIAVAGLLADRMRPFHVGDSEILLTGQRGRLKHRTLAHAPVAYALDSGYLKEKEALHHDDRHVVTNALGLAEIRIEIGPRLGVARRDTLLLATDGLTDNLYLNEIVDGVRTGAAGPRAEELARKARSRMASMNGPRPAKPDDLTFVLWRRGT